MGTEDFRTIQAIKSRLLQALADLDYVSTHETGIHDRPRRRHLDGQDSPGSDEIGNAVSGLAAIARRLLTQLDGRADYFDESLFADPAWHILLELFAAAAEGKTVSISSICQAAKVPAATALRWLRDLESRRLIERIVDESDPHRGFARISAEAFANMAAYLARISDLGQTISSDPSARLPRRRSHD